MGNNWTQQIIGDGYRYGVPNYDYINLEGFRTYQVDNSVFRKGIRNGYFVIDEEITPLGFAGQENVGWKNIFAIKS